MEQELTPGLSEGQITEFIEDDEVETIEVVRRPPLLSTARFHFQAVDQIDDIEEAAACSVADESTGDRDGQVTLSCPCAVDENDIALIGDEGAGRQLPHHEFIDGCIGEVEVIDVLGERWFGDVLAKNSIQTFRYPFTWTSCKRR